MIKKRIILAIAIPHYVIGMFAMIKAYGMAMSRFDTGAAASTSEKFWQITGSILQFPARQLVLLLPVDTFPGVIGHIPFMLCSLMWALSIYFVMIFFKHERSGA